MELKGKTAKDCCEMICESTRLGFTDSETLQKLIIMRGGKYFKVSNIERRCRESLNIRSKIIKRNGTRYAVYGWSNGGVYE